MFLRKIRMALNILIMKLPRITTNKLILYLIFLVNSAYSALRLESKFSKFERICIIRSVSFRSILDTYDCIQCSLFCISIVVTTCQDTIYLVSASESLCVRSLIKKFLVMMMFPLKFMPLFDKRFGYCKGSRKIYFQSSQRKK